MMATNSFKTRAAGLVAFLTLGLLAYGNPSEPTLTITNGNVTRTVTGVADIASFSGMVGNWDIGLAGGSVLGGPFGTVLNLSSTESSAVPNPGALTITFKDSGFTLPPTIYLHYADTSINFIGNGTTEKLESLYGAPLANTAILPVYTDMLPGAGPGVNGNVTSPLVGGVHNPFGLELEAVITPRKNGGPQNVLTIEALSANGSPTEFSNGSGSTPEPGFYGILAVGLGGLFFVVARRRRQAKA